MARCAFADAKSAGMRTGDSPNPRAHALFADKRLLVRLSYAQFLESIGVAPNDIGICEECGPLTRLVKLAHADEWWKKRKDWFLNPPTALAAKPAVALRRCLSLQRRRADRGKASPISE